MTNLSNTALGGTSGSAITTSDTASGSKWDVATPGTGGTANWDNSQAVHDPLSMTFATGVTSTSAYVAWTSGSVGSLARIWGRAYVRLPASPPTVTQVIARFLAAGAQKARIYCNTSGKLVIADSSNVAAGTTTGTVAANSWFRVEWDITSGVSNAFEFRYYASPESYTATETLTGSTTNFGAANFDEVRFGVGANFANVVGYWIDDVNVNDIGFPGPSQLWTPQPVVVARPTYILLPPAPTILRASLADVVVASSTTPQPLVVSQQPRPVAPTPTTLLRSTLADPPVLTTPSPLVVSSPTRLPIPAPTAIRRASIQDFATPVTPQPIVVTQEGLRASIPAPATLLRSSLQDFATPQTPMPLVVSAPVRWPMPPQPVIGRAPLIAAPVATAGTAAIVVAARTPLASIPRTLLLRTPVADTTPECVVVRPNAGVVTRPGSGAVARPNTGTVTRTTSGLVVRPDTGVVNRPGCHD